MSEKKKEDQNKSSESSGKNKSPKKKSGVRIILLMIIIGSLIPFGAPTLLLSLGLLPTFVALVTDTDQNKSSAITVGFLNFAGVVPFIIELWGKGQTLEAAIGIAKQPVTWLIMFGAAGIGHLILYTIPPAIATMTLTRMEMRLKTLKDGLEQLKQIWGQDIASSKTIDEVRRQN